MVCGEVTWRVWLGSGVGFGCSLYKIPTLSRPVAVESRAELNAIDIYYMEVELGVRHLMLSPELEFELGRLTDLNRAD